MHAPDRHCSPGEHVWPHEPQLWRFEVSRVHRPEHSVRPPVHPHTPPVHEVPPEQRRPQPPQLFGSLVMFTQLVPHATVPVGQDVVHIPAPHS